MLPTIEQKLFTPAQIRPIAMKRRPVMAPLTRSRSQQPGKRATSADFVFCATESECSGRDYPVNRF
jgi:2,4-dienoyl-CoA reductase-like NADH-dependent reductase (Old Yellow Enzyme family)